ncbi:MAG: hypothetical protein IKE22_04475, partial [Atopobiaceae bacterium]|nr:hypothetical protein [Atopobiaceae bacterium]
MRRKLFIRKIMAVGVTASLFMTTFPMGAFAIDGAAVEGDATAETTLMDDAPDGSDEVDSPELGGEEQQEQLAPGGEPGSEDGLDTNDQEAVATDSNGEEAGESAEDDVTDEAEDESEESAETTREKQEAAEPTGGLEGDSAEVPAEGQAPSEQKPEDGAEVSTTAARRDISKAKVSAISSQAYTGNAVKPKPTVKYGTATLKLGTDYTLSYKNNTKPGTATVTVTGKGAYAGTKSVTFKIVAPSVSYRTHVQNVGWQGWRKNGAMSGTSGRALRLEGINIKLSSKPVTGGIAYRTHVQNIGWQGWRSDGAMSGTSG